MTWQELQPPCTALYPSPVGMGRAVTKQRGGITLKVSHVSVMVIVVVALAVAIAGCSSTGPAAPSTVGAPSGGSSTPAGSSAPAAGSAVSGSSIFGNAQPYNWVEYKMVTNAGGQKMTTYMKFEKSGKCTMRMEGEGLPGGSMTIDCSSKGGQAQQAQSNPNDVKSDVKFTFAGIEPVTVPAGTYATASKYTVTSQGQTITYWTAPGVPTFVKMQSKAAEGDVVTELNGWG
jgi:hypothetical protein